MLDTPSNTVSDVPVQSFNIAYEYPVVFTRDAFSSGNRAVIDVLFLSDLGEIGSTRAGLVATLAALRKKARSSHLEVETYTWDVLPENLRAGSKAADIAREISFCIKELVG